MSQHKTVICNGALLVDCRWEKCGLTQKDFAVLAGYSVRTIRKAETGQPIRITSLEAMVAVFQSYGLQVATTDFYTDPLSIAKAFVKAWQKHEDDMVKQVQHLLSDQLRITSAGDPTTIPFAGTWHGHSGLNEFWQRYLNDIPEKATFKFQFITDGNHTVVIGHEAEQLPNQSAPSMAMPEFKAFKRAGGQRALLL